MKKIRVLRRVKDGVIFPFNEVLAKITGIEEAEITVGAPAKPASKKAPTPRKKTAVKAAPVVASDNPADIDDLLAGIDDGETHN